MLVIAREVVEQFGDVQDWRNVTGTGPYQLTDVVEGSSWTFEKVDDYWGFDPKYPDNRLPYADTVEYAIVNDPAAITALLRSGQADFMGFGLNSHLTSVDSAVNLQKTNPDLVLHPFAYRSETAIFWNVQQPPFDDFRVRRAISMAIDFDAIAENYMQGWGDASPSGPIGPAVLGYALPFEEWPGEVKQYYRYDPEAAEKLLDEAGYPRGADGVRFSTRYGHYEFFDLGYYQIAMDYLRQIGIEVEIEVLSRAVRAEIISTLSYVGLMSDTWAKEYGSPLAPLGAILLEAKGGSLEQPRPRVRRVLRKRAGRHHDSGAEGVGAEGRPARRRAAVDHQGTDSPLVRRHPAMGEGLQRGRRSRRAEPV